MVFRPGQSGNPGGRSKLEKPWTDALKAELAKISPDDTGKRSRKMAQMAAAAVKAALAGDVRAMKEIGDRVEGRAPESMVHSGDPDAPIQIEHSFRSNI